MVTHAKGTFNYTSWDENPYAETGEGGKLTRASVKQTFAGDLEGEGSVEWHFVGLQHVVGRLAGRSGEFVLETSGTFDGKTAEAEWTVIPGTGTGELEGLRGSGGFSAQHGPEAAITLDYDFD